MGQQESSSTNKQQQQQQQQKETLKSESINIYTTITDNESIIEYPILAMGDSITKGYYWGGRNFHPYSIKLTQLLNKKNTKVYEFGYSGEITKNMKERLKRMIDKNPSDNDQLIHTIGKQYDNIPESEMGPMHLPQVHFKGAIIIGGTNDIAYGYSSEEIANNLIEMFEYCFEKKVEWVVACSIPSSQYDADKNPSVVKILEKKTDVNRRVKDYVMKQEKLGKKIIFVDFMEELNYCTCSQNDKELWDDTLHYTPAGSDRIAEILFNHLSKTEWITDE